MRYLLDTNILIYDCNSVDSFEEVVVCSQVLEELDGLKNSMDEVGFKARQAIKKLDNSNVEYIVKDIYDVPEGWERDKRDNKILMCAKNNNCVLVSNDVNVRIKAKSIGLECIKYEGKVNDEIYTGYREVVMSEYEQSVFYQCMTNEWDLLVNQYLIIRDEASGEVIDRQKWTERGFMPICKTPMNSMMFGKFKPKDVYQELAIDSLNSEDMTIFFGAAGTCKTMAALAYIFQKIQSNKVDSCTIIHNPQSMLKAAACGFFPGTRSEKLISSSLGGILSSKLGDAGMVDTFIAQGKLVLIPLSESRGFEVKENSILYITEGQNMDIYLLKTVIQRAKEGVKVIIEGDIEDQVDHYSFANERNGMRRAIEIFKGEKEFSCVKLKNIYRGKLAELADKM